MSGRRRTFTGLNAGANKLIIVYRPTNRGLQARVERSVNSALSWCTLWFEGVHHEEREKHEENDKSMKIPNIKKQINLK